MMNDAVHGIERAPAALDPVICKQAGRDMEAGRETEAVRHVIDRAREEILAGHEIDVIRTSLMACGVPGKEAIEASHRALEEHWDAAFAGADSDLDQGKEDSPNLEAVRRFALAFLREDPRRAHLETELARYACSPRVKAYLLAHPEVVREGRRSAHYHALGGIVLILVALVIGWFSGPMVAWGHDISTLIGLMILLGVVAIGRGVYIKFRVGSRWDDEEQRF